MVKCKDAFKIFWLSCRSKTSVTVYLWFAWEKVQKCRLYFKNEEWITIFVESKYWIFRKYLRKFYNICLGIIWKVKFYSSNIMITISRLILWTSGIRYIFLLQVLWMEIDALFLSNSVSDCIEEKARLVLFGILFHYFNCIIF